jgi:uncharacterized membrane protein
MSRTHFIVGFIIVLAIFTRFYKVDKLGLTKDEVITLAISNGQDATVFGGIQFYADSTNWLEQIKNEDNLAGTLDATIHDNGNALLYNLSVHIVTDFFGNSDVSFKSTSIFCGLLLIVSIFFFVKKHIGLKEAFIASILGALHPFLIEYSQLSRGYMMAALFSCWATHLLFNLLSDPVKKKVPYVLYSLCIVAALLSHYFTAFIFVSHGVIILLYNREKKTVLHFSAAFAVAGFLFSIWLFNGGLKGQELMLEQNSRWEGLAESAQNRQLTFSTLGNSFIRHVNALGGNRIGPLALPAIFSYLTAFGFFSFLAFFLFKSMTKITKEIIVIPIVFGLCLTAISIFTGHTLAFDLRYATPVFPVVIILTSVAIVSTFGKNKLIGVCVLLGFICIEVITSYPDLLVNVQQKPRDIEMSYPKRAEFIETIQEEGDTLVFPSVKDAILINLYFSKLPSDSQVIDKKIDKDNILLKNGKKNIVIPLDTKRY